MGRDLERNVMGNDSFQCHLENTCSDEEISGREGSTSDAGGDGAKSWGGDGGQGQGHRWRGRCLETGRRGAGAGLRPRATGEGR